MMKHLSIRYYVLTALEQSEALTLDQLLDRIAQPTGQTRAKLSANLVTMQYTDLQLISKTAAGYTLTDTGRRWLDHYRQEFQTPPRNPVDAFFSKPRSHTP